LSIAGRVFRIVLVTVITDTLGMKSHLFAYGTLEIPAVMYAVTGQHYPPETAILPGYTRYLLANKPYPGIVPQLNAEVAGMLYRNLNPHIWRCLDRYEDDFYQRQQVTVLTTSGESIDAWTYCIPQDKHALLSQLPWDRRYFIKHRLRRFLVVISRRIDGQCRQQKV
jgi:gamma-glutamylcyclotransferase (GGCT)/AIG2-like uncharacterized protein YtfP